MSDHARCFVDPAGWTKDGLLLSPDEEHHLLDVLRLGAGDAVAAFDGRGREAMARIEAGPRSGRRGSGAPRVILKVEGVRVEDPPLPAVVLAQAVPKGPRMDWVVEKATELGVTSIVPAITGRVVGRWSGGEGRTRGERWRRIAVNAARQCGTSWVPGVADPQPYAEAIRLCRASGLILIGSLRPGARPIRDAVRDAASGASGGIAVLIGPEGDFTEGELDEAAAAGAVEVSFGSRVLRTDTAAIFALSVVMSEFATRAGPGVAAAPPSACP